MKIIECPRCGMKLNAEAVACNRCAYPSKKFFSIYYSNVKICSDKKRGLSDVCRAYDIKLNMLAECKIGDILKIKCTEPMIIFIEIFGCMCKPEIVIYPGENYNVKLKKIGVITVENL